MIIWNESMDFNDPKELDYPQLFDDPSYSMIHNMYKTMFVHCCDLVPNLVVVIENFKFCLFVCLLVCLYLTFCQFCKRKMVQSWFQKLFWNQDCGMVWLWKLQFTISIFFTALFCPCIVHLVPKWSHLLLLLPFCRSHMEDEHSMICWMLHNVHKIINPN